MMLNKNEVLSFGLDDAPATYHGLSTIVVQAKDLYLYVIDFTNNQLLQKICDVRQAIVMKSILREQAKIGRHAEDIESFNEFI